MKLRYLLPFLFLPLFPQDSKAQFKAESNKNSLDVKSEYVDISLNNDLGLRDLINVKGDVKLKYGDNALYVIRNGLLNHTYGVNIDLEFLQAYHNRSEQSIRKETRKVQDSPIGEITTETTILDKSIPRDFGFALGHRGFFASYETAFKENEIDGSTVITINGTQEIVPFSSRSDITSRTYGVGFRNGFIKFIQNRHQNTGEEEQTEERFNNYLVNANYSFWGRERKRINLDVYYGQDVSDFPDFNPQGISGVVNVNILRDIDVNFFYNGRDSTSFTANLSNSDYSRLNHRSFERGLEDRLRAVPRIHDSPLEVARRRLADMFFTKPLSYDFSVSIDKEKKVTVNANLNLKYALFHYSEESQMVGFKLGFAIGTYDFEQNEARFGVFFGAKTN